MFLGNHVARGTVVNGWSPWVNNPQNKCDVFLANHVAHSVCFRLDFRLYIRTFCWLQTEGLYPFLLISLKGLQSKIVTAAPRYSTR